MNKFFVSLFLGLLTNFSIFAAQTPPPQTVQASAQKITLKIFPHFLIESRNFFNQKKQTLIYALLSGFEFTNNQVQIDRKSTDRFLMPPMGGKEYTTETLIEALLNGKENSYPLHLHKKLTYLNQESRLEIVLCEKNKPPVTIMLPNNMNNRILIFLQQNMESERFDCWVFFKIVFFDNFCINLNDLNITQIFALKDIQLGDGILLESMVDGKQKITHCAIALGGNLFISKLGANREICITTLQTLFSTYNCKSVFKVIGRKS